MDFKVKALLKWPEQFNINTKKIVLMELCDQTEL